MHRLPLSALILPIFWLPVAVTEFNFEIGLRVHERLTEFMSTPPNLLDFVSNYRSNLALEPDRDSFLLLGDALLKSHPHWMIYYGLEDGELAGNFYSPRHGNYREPGDGGYIVDDGVQNKHYVTCVHETGDEKPCQMNAGDEYIECVDGCSLQRCEDEDSQRDCSVFGGEEKALCEASIKWCKSYEIKKVEDDVPRGFIPLSYYCLDSRGLPTQEPDTVLEFLGDDLGNCYYDDKVTLVDRKLSGEYDYCAGEALTKQCSSQLEEEDTPNCNTTFAGAFRTSNYDPRYRPWYLLTRKLQRPNWTPPFVFWDANAMGITYVEPIYTTGEGKSVFYGVLAIDYKFSDIASFLSNNYQGSENIVAIVEASAPNYIIASSTGGTGTKRVMASDNTQPCPPNTDADCQSVRVDVNSLNNLVSVAFLSQSEAGFPEAELVPVEYDGTIYASETKPFNVASHGVDYDGIDWLVLIMSPIRVQGVDTVKPRSSMLASILVPAIVGSLLCSILLALFIKNRHTREFALGDWRFTGAFIFGCIVLNLACLSFIGENTNVLCLLRMWLLHFSFVLALAPLFTKTWRMYLLVGSPGFRRQTISHTKTFLMTMPFILVEVLILLVFSFADPSQETALIDQDGFVITYRVVCAHDTQAFFSVQLVYEGGLLLVGCFLAYKTRNMEEGFGECKQLFFAMYNIALLASIILIVLKAVEIYSGMVRVFVTVGVCWCTSTSSCVFVLPRLFQLKQRISRISTSRVSGILPPRQLIATGGLSSQQSVPGHTEMHSAPGNSSIPQGSMASQKTAPSESASSKKMVSWGDASMPRGPLSPRESVSWVDTPEKDVTETLDASGAASNQPQEEHDTKTEEWDARKEDAAGPAPTESQQYDEEELTAFEEGEQMGIENQVSEGEDAQGEQEVAKEEEALEEKRKIFFKCPKSQLQ